MLASLRLIPLVLVAMSQAQDIDLIIDMTQRLKMNESQFYPTYPYPGYTISNVFNGSMDGIWYVIRIFLISIPHPLIDDTVTMTPYKCSAFSIYINY